MWEEIAEDLRRRVDEGEWAAGERLPSVRELAAHYAMPTQNTIIQAIKQLTNEGVLLTDRQAPRRGVRVRARPRLVRPIDEHFATALAPQDRTFEQISGIDDISVEITYDRVQPDSETQFLGEETLLVRTFLYFIQGTPHQVMQSWMLDRVARAAGLRTRDDEVPGKSTNTWLHEAGIELDRATLTLESRLPTPDEAKLLNTKLPVMVRKRTHYDSAGQAIEISTTTVVADQLVYRADFSVRNPGC
ncbi:GntR family transcriptional regulator [Nocardia brasiliensis]|uniref:GntR family transcriptional regulator n=1 Tax=Streptomyces sp. NPDC056056 TaxID=3345698 RepID=UPI0035E33FAB